MRCGVTNRSRITDLHIKLTLLIFRVYAVISAGGSQGRQERLRSLFADRDYRAIYLRAYASVPYQKVVELLGLIKGVRADRLNLISDYIENDSR